MDKEETASRIIVMQAYVNGQVIEAYQDGKWRVFDKPYWFPNVEYRIGDIEYKSEERWP